GRRGAGPSSWGAAETARSARTVRRRGRCRKVLVPCIILRSLTDFSHRHSGALNVPADQDQDEATDPNQADLRVLDGFHPGEPLLEFLQQQGVTVLHVVPGPSNVL